MKAQEIYQVLDQAGLTPPVHYCAAPLQWQLAMEKLEAEIEADRYVLARAIAAHGARLPVAPIGQMDLSKVESK